MTGRQEDRPVVPRLLQVQIRNYKSIARASVGLAPLTVFIGPNGAGKSNFIDVLSFVQQCLSDSIEHAFRSRGGIAAVRRRSGGHPTHIGVRLIMDLGDDVTADYGFEIAAKPREQFRVAEERCCIGRFMEEEHSFHRRGDKFIKDKEIPGIRARVPADRLALFAASATEEFRPAYDFLTSMRFYSIVPERLRALQDPDPGVFLKRNGDNAPAILRQLKEDARDNDGYQRICRLLSKVVEGMAAVDYRSVAQKETLEFKQDVGLKQPWTFEALSMSDGTLRVLGLLLAVYQRGPTSVLAIEEPEATVHPAVCELVVQILMDAASEKQVLVTTHSPDLLDYKDLTDDQIRVVTMQHGQTIIAPLAPSARDAIRKRLYTAGDLLRVNELNPDLEAAKEMQEQLNLFGRPLPNRNQGT